MVDAATEELQRRVNARGDTGQIQKAEQTALLLKELHQKVTDMDRKLDLIVQTMTMQR